MPIRWSGPDMCLVCLLAFLECSHSFLLFFFLFIYFMATGGDLSKRWRAVWRGRWPCQMLCSHPCRVCSRSPESLYDWFLFPRVPSETLTLSYPIALGCKGATLSLCCITVVKIYLISILCNSFYTAVLYDCDSQSLILKVFSQLSATINPILWNLLWNRELWTPFASLIVNWLLMQCLRLCACKHCQK